MGMDDLAKGALVLIGVGLVSKRFGAGVGLGELGVGVQQLISAPGVGVGLGLTGTATGIRDIAETFGDLGRGLGKLFEAVPGGFWGNGYRPGFPDAWTPQEEALPKEEGVRPPGPPLITVSGGSGATLAAGGGQNVLTPLIAPAQYILPPGAVGARARIVQAGGRVERTEKNSGGSSTMRGSLV